MSTINGRSFSTPRNVNLKGQGVGRGGILRFEGKNTTNPFSATANGLYINNSNQLVSSLQGTTTVIGAVGAGGTPTWESLFAADATFNVAGTTWTIDNSSGNNAVVTVTNTGAGSGALIQLTNAGTGEDIRGDSGTWSVTKAGVATFAAVSVSGTSSAFTFTGAAVWTLLDNSATALSIGAAGDTNMLVFDTSNAQPIVKFNDYLTVVDGNATFISTSNTVSNVLVTNNTATTFGADANSSGVMVVRSTSLTTGSLLQLQLTEGTLNGGFYLTARDVTGSANVFTLGEDGAVVIAGAAASTVFTITNGDVVLSDSSITLTDADNAATLDVINNTATTAAVVRFASTTATFTGTTTGAYVYISHSGLTTGTLLGLTAVAASTSVGVVDIAVAGLTSGSALRITAATANFTTGGKLIELTSTAAVAGNLLTATTTGAYSGTGMVLITAGAMTTGITLSIVSTTGLTSGSLIRATSSTAGAIATNGAVSFTATGAFTTAAAVGFVSVQANTTTAGYVMDISATSLTTGVGLAIANGSSAMTSGSLLRITAGGTGAIATNGIVSFTHSGDFTSTSAINGGFVEVKANSTTAGTIINVLGTALTTGVALNISNGTAATTSGSLLRVAAGGTGAVATNGIVSFTHTGVYTSTTAINGGFVEIKASATTAGTILNIVGAALTTGVGVNISNGTSGVTTGSLLRVTAGGTGTVATNGVVNFVHSGIFGSTSNAGFVNITANASTGGTILAVNATGLTDGVGIYSPSAEAGLTTGKYMSLGGGVFTIAKFGATVIAGSALGTAALTLTAGDATITSGNLVLTAGTIQNTPQAIVNANTAISVVTLVTTISNAGATTHTLADGTVGQIKVITQTTYTGDAVITPANFVGTTITLNAAGDSWVGIFAGTEWRTLALAGTAAVA